MTVYLRRFSISVIILIAVTACSSATSPLKTTEEQPPTQIASPKEAEKKDIILPSDEPESLELSVKDYTIAEPDALYISVWKEPELSASVKVRPDGKISFPLIGDVYVRGMTPDELKKELTTRLEKYIVQPLVYVKIETIESQRVYLLGAFESPKVLQLTHKTTLLEAITQAGGIAIDKYTGEEIGDTENAYISRNNIILDINFRKLLRENDMKQNIPLKPGDIIYMPPAISPGSEVYVFGEVNAPGRISLKKDARISEILARAGGLPKENYTVGDIAVVRGNIKNPQVINIDFKKIISGDLTHDIQMKHRDIVYVSSTTIKKWKDMSDKILSFVSTANMAASNIISWDEASVILRGQKKR